MDSKREKLEKLKRKAHEIDEETLAECLRKCITGFSLLSYIVPLLGYVTHKPLVNSVVISIKSNYKNGLFKVWKTESLIKMVEECFGELEMDLNPDSFSKHMASLLKSKIIDCFFTVKINPEGILKRYFV